MATVLAFTPPAPAPVKRDRSPRCLKPRAFATPDFARRMADGARGYAHPHRRLTATEAHAVAIRLIQLTAYRLYREDNLALLSLAEHLRVAAEHEKYVSY